MCGRQKWETNLSCCSSTGTDRARGNVSRERDGQRNGSPLETLMPKGCGCGSIKSGYCWNVVCFRLQFKSTYPALQQSIELGRIHIEREDHCRWEFTRQNHQMQQNSEFCETRYEKGPGSSDKYLRDILLMWCLQARIMLDQSFLGRIVRALSTSWWRNL